MRTHWVACALGLLGSTAWADTRMSAARGDAGTAHVTTNQPNLVALLSESREREVTLKLQEMAADREKLATQVQAQGKAYVRLLRLGILPLSSGFDGLVRHATRMEGLSQAIERRQQLIRSLDAQAGALKDGVAESRRQRNDLRVHLSEVQRSRDAILAAREREAAYRRAFGGEVGNMAVYSGLRAGDQAATFAELRGRLPLPVEGRAEVTLVEPSTSHGPAVRLRVGLAATARSVHAGRVVLIGEHDAGGRSVVVDHGGGYTSVTANLARVHVHTGDELARGAVLGEVGASKGTGVVYFEVKKDGVGLFPSDWFGL
jgi:murein hydrolase activator